MSIRTALLARLKKGLSDIVHVLPTSMGTKVVAVAVVFFSIAILFRIAQQIICREPPPIDQRCA